MASIQETTFDTQQYLANEQELEQLLDSVEQMLADPPPQPDTTQNEHQRIEDLLDNIQHELKLHFSIEEAAGYLADPIEVAPHLADEAEHLRGEHGSMLATFNELMEKMDIFGITPAEKTDTTVLEQEFQQFHETLMQHEEAEDELLQRAFCEDLGVGD